MFSAGFSKYYTIEFNAIIGEHTRTVKKNVKTILREVRGLALDQVSEENDKGSISNDVNQERRFFKHGSLNITVACVPIK